jgi:hypothetical protein
VRPRLLSNRAWAALGAVLALVGVGAFDAHPGWWIGLTVAASFCIMQADD